MYLLFNQKKKSVYIYLVFFFVDNFFFFVDILFFFWIKN